MSNERPLTTVERTLAIFDGDPADQIEAAKRLNRKISDVFGINEFLIELNERIFKGEGKIISISQGTTIEPDLPEEGERDSRFRKLFTLKYSPAGNYLGAELRHTKKKNSFDQSPFSAVGIKVYQSIDIPNRKFSISILGKLHFSVGRGDNGRWNGRPTVLCMESQGKYLEFSFDSVPSESEIRETFWENTLQILRDMAIGEFIPSTDFNNESQPES